MADPQRQIYLPKIYNIEQVFPVLKPELIERIMRYGRHRKVERGEVLMEPGTKNVTFFVVQSGELELVRSPGASENIVAIAGPGQFTGEANVLFGRPVVVQI